MNNELALDSYSGVFCGLSTMDSPESNEIKEKLQHFDRLGMREAYNQQVKGAVAFVLESNGMKLIHDDIKYSDGTHLISKVDKKGMHSRIRVKGNCYWNLCALKYYPRGDVPLELLKKLPSDSGEKTQVFYLSDNPDPILVYPLPNGDTIMKRQIDRYGILNLKKITKLVDTGISASPYYIGLYEWE